MAGDKYIKNSGGTLTEQAAIQSSAGAGDAGKLVALDAAGLLAQSMMPTGIGPDTKDIPTSENLAAGDYVNIWDDTGTAKVRKADGSSIGKEAHGFVLAAVTSPANAAVYFEGKNNQLSGLTPGATYFLSAVTPGAGTATAPSAAGNIVQRVGRSISATEVSFEAAQPIVLA